MDVSKTEEIEAWIKATVGEFGRLDGAANVAGIAGGDGETTCETIVGAFYPLSGYQSSWSTSAKRLKRPTEARRLGSNAEYQPERSHVLHESPAATSPSPWRGHRERLEHLRSSRTATQRGLRDKQIRCHWAYRVCGWRVW